MTKKKNGDAVAEAVPPNEVRYKGLRKQSSGRYGAEIRIPTYIWIGTFDTPEQAVRAFDMAARKYRGPKAKTNFPPTNEDNLENANPLDVSDVNNPDKSSDIGSSFKSSDGLMINQNPLSTCFPAFNSDNYAPLQMVLKEYDMKILRRGGVISRNPKSTNHIQKEMTGDFNGDNGSDSGCELQDQPPTTNHLELNLDLTLALPGTM